MLFIVDYCRYCRLMMLLLFVLLVITCYFLLVDLRSLFVCFFLTSCIVKTISMQPIAVVDVFLLIVSVPYVATMPAAG